MGGRSVNWFELDQDRYRWLDLVNAATNIWFPYNAGISLTS